MRVETSAIWIANLLAVTVLPLALGRSQTGVSGFALYAAATGLVLTMMEDTRILQALVTRSDVRAYLQVRVVLAAALAIGPYLTGRLLAG
jgi:hypothetical protein